MGAKANVFQMFYLLKNNTKSKKISFLYLPKFLLINSQHELTICLIGALGVCEQKDRSAQKQ